MQRSCRRTCPVRATPIVIANSDSDASGTEPLINGSASVSADWLRSGATTRIIPEWIWSTDFQRTTVGFAYSVSEERGPILTEGARLNRSRSLAPRKSQSKSPRIHPQKSVFQGERRIHPKRSVFQGERWECCASEPDQFRRDKNSIAPEQLLGTPRPAHAISMRALPRGRFGMAQ